MFYRGGIKAREYRVLTIDNLRSFRESASEKMISLGLENLTSDDTKNGDESGPMRVERLSGKVIGRRPASSLG